MGNKLETAPEETIGEGKCCHYWIIEMAQGPTCRGICHFCSGKKETDSFGPDWKPPIATIYNTVSPREPDIAPSPNCVSLKPRQAAAGQAMEAGNSLFVHTEAP